MLEIKRPKKNLLAIIPARKNSQRLLNKNTRELAGKPLVMWTIEAALGAVSVDAIAVTSDDPLTLSIANTAKVDYVIERDPRLAQNDTPSWRVVEDVLERVKASGDEFKSFVLLQPTSPLRKARDIDQANELFRTMNAKGVISCKDISKELKNLICSSFGLQVDKRIALSEVYTPDKTKHMALNGSIYIVEVAYFLKTKLFVPEIDCFYFLQNEASSIDIDNEIEFLIADACMQKSNFKN